MEVLPLEVATSRLQEDQASLRLHQSKEETREPTAAPPFAEDLHSTTEAFAEGGLRGWMAVAGAFLVLMNTFGCELSGCSRAARDLLTRFPALQMPTRELQ